MNNLKYSLYIKLVIVIFLTVVSVISLSSTYDYINTKEKIILDMKNDSKSAIISLKNNVSGLISSYSVNEYENLIHNSFEGKNIFAIIVSDYNMGKIMGKETYITGKIRNENFNIIDYNINDVNQNKRLKNAYFSDSFEITSIDGKKLGMISIYISDSSLNEALNNIIKYNLKNTLIISFILILGLFIGIRFFILSPVSSIIDAIKDCDEDGIPIRKIPNSSTVEINALSSTMNNMIDSIKKSRLALKENENRLEKLLEMSPIAVRISKNNGNNVIFSNKAYAKLLGVNKSRTLNLNPEDYYVNKSVYRQIVQKLQHNEIIYNMLIQLLVNNKEVWALASYMNMMVEDENVMIGWFYNVTQEKNNEIKLHEALALQTTIFDNSGYLIIRTDKNGIIKQVNKEVEKLLGYDTSELIDKHSPKIIHLESEVKQKSEEFSKELKCNVEPSFEVFIIKSNLGLKNEQEWTYVAKDGRHIPVLLSVSALRDNNNEIYGYLGIAKDITEQKIIESQSKLASMGEMIGNIAHQWRQPLSVISAIASGIKIRSEFSKVDTEDMLNEMTHIVEQTQYLSNTIDDFRNFIKDSNKKENFYISEVIEKTLSIVKSTLRNNDVNIILDIEDDILINGFKNQLIQSFINIINNAKDALNEKGESFSKFLFITTKKYSDNFELIIKDNAGGIPEDIHDKIFEPYFTTKHQNVGTGIGLSMVHQIITKHHNASIEVHNESFTYEDNDYEGACFIIKFNA